MKDAIVITQPAPGTVTMSVDATVYRGHNRIRRNTGHTHSLYEGRAMLDRVIDLNAGEAFELDLVGSVGDAFEAETRSDAFYTEGDSLTRFCKCIFIDTTGPIQVALDAGAVELVVNKHLCTDHPASSLIVTNSGCCGVRVLIQYLV